MLEDDQDLKPLVIDTAADAITSSELDHTVLDRADAGGSEDLPSRSESSPVVPLAECCDEEVDYGADLDQSSEHHLDGSLSSDSLSTSGSKDATGSGGSGDVSPGPGTSAGCSKSRRKSDRVCTLPPLSFDVCCWVE